MNFTVLGGRLSPEINLNIWGQLAISDEQVKSHIEHTASIGLPTYREFKKRKKHLAVIGGGPSINDHKQQIREWDGDVWAINGAHGWCRELGLEPVFITGDPHPEAAKWATGCKQALIESRSSPELVKALSGAEVFTYDTGNGPGQVRSGSSTVTAVPHLAVRIGYESVTLFGCESSFAPTGTHAYQCEERTQLMIIEAGGERFLTAPDFYAQMLELTRYIREVPEYVKEESGGLLRAVLKGKEFHILWLSEDIAISLTDMTDEKPRGDVYECGPLCPNG